MTLGQIFDNFLAKKELQADPSSEGDPPRRAHISKTVIEQGFATEEEMNRVFIVFHGWHTARTVLDKKEPDWEERRKVMMALIADAHSLPKYNS